MLKPYKEPKVYDADGDLSKKWFVYYSFINPDTGKFQRFREYHNINSFSTKSERLLAATEVASRLRDLFRKGYNPFELTLDQEAGGIHTIRQAVDFYLSVKKPSIRPKTYTGYKSILSHLTAYLGSRELTKITPAMIQEYFDSARRTRASYANVTYNAELTAIRVFFSFWVDRQKLSINPARAVKRLKEDIQQHQAYSDAEVSTIVERLQQRNTPRADQMLAYIRCIYYACIRPQELLRLRIHHVNLTKNIITIPGESAKGKRTESVEISPGLRPVIAELVKDAEPNWYLFGQQGKGANYCIPKPGPKPAGRNYFSKYYRELMKELGYPATYTMYGWKHTRNIHLFADGVDIYRIMRHNRHSSLDMTQKYLRQLGLFLDSSLNDSRRV